MHVKDFKKLKVPKTPGVYTFWNGKKQAIYIGKATSLRERLRSYFAKDLLSTRGPKLVKMVEDAQKLTWEETDSVLEALILEANLIKQYKPEGNTRDKDNKSFNYLVITKDEYPRVLVVRGRELFTKWEEKKIKYLYGPFPSGGALKSALKIIRKIFPFRDRCEVQDAKPCFNRQIGLCPGVCEGKMTKAEYAKRIQHINLLFQGKKSSLLKDLEKDMKALAKNEEFEEAQELKKKIFALKHIKDTALLGDEYAVSGGGLGRIEAYDVAHMSEKNRVGVMVVIEDSVPMKDEYRKFTIQTEKMGDTAALEEVLKRRFNHVEWQLPKIIVIDGGVAQKNVAKRVLDEYGYSIALVNVVKNEKHKAGKVVGNPKLIAQAENDIIRANAEAHRFAVQFYRQKSRKGLR